MFSHFSFPFQFPFFIKLNSRYFPCFSTCSLCVLNAIRLKKKKRTTTMLNIHRYRQREMSKIHRQAHDKTTTRTTKTVYNRTYAGFQSKVITTFVCLAYCGRKKKRIKNRLAIFIFILFSVDSGIYFVFTSNFFSTSRK